MPTGKVEGHAGELVAGRLGGLPVVMLSGRAHYYEGFSMPEVVFGVRVCRLLGAETLFLTNAAGGLTSELRPGDLMLIRDHIHLLTGDNPLRGPNESRFGTRFPDMTDLYRRHHRDLMARVARANGIDLKSGVYVCVPGPSYETPAEVRMLRLLGADAVGMSTTAEAIAAAHAGMAVVGVSCITNAAAGLGGSALNHDEVKEVAGQASASLQTLAVAFAEALAAQYRGACRE
jgi:purine-nucleoside phosphorylase